MGESAVQLIAVFANVATAIAVVVAVFQFIQERRNDREQRRYDAYNALNDQYVALIRRAAEVPDVDCFDERLERSLPPTTPEAIRVEKAAFLELISLMERAYVFYHRLLTQGDPFYKKQWPGWDLYCTSFMKRSRFCVTWDAFKSEFDNEFVAWLDGTQKPQGNP